MQIHWNPDLEKRLCEIPRSHPWVASSEDDKARYEDFRRNPQAVREVLEDFQPYEHRPAVQRFYELLIWANGPDATIETNDCLLRVIGDPTPAVRGHLTFFFRDLELNCGASSVAWLCRQIEDTIGTREPGFSAGVFDYARWPVKFTALRDGSSQPRAGNLINLRFMATGADENEAFANLERTFGNLHAALREVSDRAGNVMTRSGHHGDGVAEEVGTAKIS